MSPRPRKAETLVDKIAKAFAEVDKLKRRGTHAGTDETENYPYTRASDVLEEVRQKLFSRGVLICPNEGQPEYISVMTNGGEMLTECRLAVAYIFRDAIEQLEPMTCHGVARDKGDKALYKAQTGAQKALLKRFGLMAEEFDDPEFDGQSYDGTEPLRDAPPAHVPSSQRAVTFPQIRAFNEACASTNKTQEEISTYLFHQHQVTGVKDLKRGKPFTEALKWAASGTAASGGAAPAPKLVAAPVQGKLPMPAPPPPPIELRIGNQTVQVESKTKSYAL